MKINNSSFSYFQGIKNENKLENKGNKSIKQVDKGALDIMENVGRAQVAFGSSKGEESEFISFEDKLEMMKKKGIKSIQVIEELLQLPESLFKIAICYVGPKTHCNDIYSIIKEPEAYKITPETEEKPLEKEKVDYAEYGYESEADVPDKIKKFVEMGMEFYEAKKLCDAHIEDPELEEAIAKININDEYSTVSGILAYSKEKPDTNLKEASLYAQKGISAIYTINLSNSGLCRPAKEYMAFCMKYNLDSWYDEIKEKEQLGFFDEPEKVELAKEFVKRGLKAENALLFSRFKYNNSEEICRAAELFKSGYDPLDAYNIARDDDKYLDAMRNINYKLGYEKGKQYNASTMHIIKVMASQKIGLERAKLMYKNIKEFSELCENYVHYNDPKALILYSKQEGLNPEYTIRILLDEIAEEKYQILKAKTGDNRLAAVMACSKVDIEDKEKIELIKRLMDKKFSEDINKKVQNPNIKNQIEAIFDFNNISPDSFIELINSGMSYDEIVDLSSEFCKKPLKLAMKKPNQYLSDIPLKYTTKINGKYPILKGDELKELQEKFIFFADKNISKILKTIKYLDTDTFNQMMDKRTAAFEKYLTDFSSVSKKNCELISKLIKLKNKKGEPLTAKEKIELSKIIINSEYLNIDVDNLNNLEFVDVKELKLDLLKKIFLSLGFSEDEFKSIPSEKLNFDEDYIPLLMSDEAALSFRYVYNDIVKPVQKSDAIKKVNIDRLKDIRNDEERMAHDGLNPEALSELIKILETKENSSKKELYKIVSNLFEKRNVSDTNLETIIRMAVMYDFKEFIQNPNNKFGKTNAETKKEFEKNNINYDMWFNKDEKQDIDFKVQDRNYKITMWERCPQKDLFIGNKTSCCTGLGEANGSSTPIYLANTMFNVVEMKDEKGNTIAMSRIYMANVDGKPALIMDNIEANADFLKNANKKEQLKTREMFFLYMKNYAGKLTGSNKTKIYFSTSYTKLPYEDLTQKSKKIDIIGDTTCGNFYCNASGDWTSKEELKEKKLEFYEV